MSKINTDKEFELVAILIEEARNRAFHKVNKELVLLYFKVGNIVSSKVAEGTWGDNTVEDLAIYIESKYPELKGFNRRGLYRMKQFFEICSDPKFVSTLSIQLQMTENEAITIVSTLLTQLHWSSHLLIISKTKTAEEKIFYIQSAITEKWSVRDLDRQLNSAVFERAVLASKKVLPKKVLANKLHQLVEQLSNDKSD